MKNNYSIKILGVSLLFTCLSVKAQVVETFTFTGSMQTFTVPACVSQVTITAHGAQGSNGYASTSPAGIGGLGAIVTGTYPVSSGDVLNIFVGGAGTLTTGGFNGGGVNAGNSSAGGGGASDVRFNGIGLTDRIIVAGGGGAGGNGGCFGSLVPGGNGGPGGGNGSAGGNSSAGGGGFPGVGSFFGSFGVGCGPFQGLSGSNGSGGVGGAGGLGTSLCTTAPTTGGSGGGGFIGGGGGGAGAAGTVGCQFNDTGGGGGGAGGDCYTDALMTSTVITVGGAAAGNGLVTISYFFTSTTSTTTDISCDSYDWNGNTFTATGTYIDTIPNAAGCDSIMTLNLTINTSPTANLTLGMDSVCISMTAFALTAGTPSGGTFSGTGVSGGNFDPSVAGVGTHEIIYSFTDVNSCSDADTASIVVLPCLGFDDESLSGLMTSYPNPFSVQTIINTTEILNNATLSVSNCFGQLVKQLNNLSGQTIILNRDNLPNGVYFLQLHQNNKLVQSGKIIIAD